MVMIAGHGGEDSWDDGGDVGFRCKCNANGKPVLVDGKPVLEFIAVKRADNKMWAIPGVSQGCVCPLCVCVCVNVNADGHLCSTTACTPSFEKNMLMVLYRSRERVRVREEREKNPHS